MAILEDFEITVLGNTSTNASYHSLYALSQGRRVVIGEDHLDLSFFILAMAFLFFSFRFLDDEMCEMSGSFGKTQSTCLRAD
jgi:hypothetical protein